MVGEGVEPTKVVWLTEVDSLAMDPYIPRPPRYNASNIDIGQLTAGLVLAARDFDNTAVFSSDDFHATVQASLQQVSDDSNDLKTPSPRQGFARGSDSTVYTNHFAVELPKADIHEFQIIGMNSTDKKVPPRDKTQAMMDEIILSCPALHDNRNDYATDRMSLIVSWVDLRPHFGAHFINAKPGTEVFAKEILYRAASKRNPKKFPEAKRTLKVIYMGLVPMQEFLSASTSEAAHLLVEPQEDIQTDANDERIHTISAVHAMNLHVRGGK